MLRTTTDVPPGPGSGQTGSVVRLPTREEDPRSCTRCGESFKSHTYVLETLTVECPDHGSRPLVDWLRPSDPTFAQSHSTLLGTRFDSLDQEAVVSFILDAISAGRGGWVVTPNVDILRQMAIDEKYESLVRHASLVLVDGAPLEWAARVSGQGTIHRTPGSTLMMPLAAGAHAAGVPLLLLGGREGAAELASAALSQAYPGLDVRWHCPPFGFEHDAELWLEVEEVVGQCAGGIVMCGLGAPKQELVASRLLAANPHSWFLGVGATIDFTAGMVSRAPEWMQRSGTEWLYRLAVEPRRLFHRYVVDDLPFVARLLSWAVRTRFSRNLAVTAQAYADGSVLAALPAADLQQDVA